MPYKIPGQPGTWYEPGTRKGNVTIAWRGSLPDGKRTEVFTDSTTDAGAQAFVRRFFERWHRDRPATDAAEVDLATAAHHYKADRARSDAERDRVDRIVALIGGTTPVRHIGQVHLTQAAAAFRAQRATAAAQAKALRKRGKGGQVFPLPSTATLNRELTTPLRAIVNFADEQRWCTKVVLRALKRQEGEAPSRPRPIARDADVELLLAAIADRLAELRPTGKGRDLNYHRRRNSLTALYALVLLVHERGFRISEWLRWEWTDVDLERAAGRILITKPDRWQDFDLSPQAVAALAAIEPKTGKVFPLRHRSNVYNAVDKVAPAGVRWRPHESRRAVVTAVIRNTGDPTVARDYVGHASVKTTLRYRIVDQVELGPSVRRNARIGHK